MSLEGLSKLQSMDINDIVSFSLYPRTVYGEGIKRAKFQGRVTSRNTRFYGVLAKEEHDHVFNELPAGTPDDPDAYAWLIFELPMGDVIVLGEPWIKADSIVFDTPVTVHTFRVTGGNEIPARVRHALNSIGIYDLEYVTNK